MMGKNDLLPDKTDLILHDNVRLGNRHIIILSSFAVENIFWLTFFTLMGCQVRQPSVQTPLQDVLLLYSTSKKTAFKSLIIITFWDLFVCVFEFVLFPDTIPDHANCLKNHGMPYIQLCCVCIASQVILIWSS